MLVQVKCVGKSCECSLWLRVMLVDTLLGVQYVGEGEVC